jgi:hypothetical protein
MLVVWAEDDVSTITVALSCRCHQISVRRRAKPELRRCEAFHSNRTGRRSADIAKGRHAGQPRGAIEGVVLEGRRLTHILPQERECRG